MNFFSKNKKIILLSGILLFSMFGVVSKTFAAIPSMTPKQVYAMDGTQLANMVMNNSDYDQTYRKQLDVALAAFNANEAKLKETIQKFEEAKKKLADCKVFCSYEREYLNVWTTNLQNAVGANQNAKLTLYTLARDGTKDASGKSKLSTESADTLASNSQNYANVANTASQGQYSNQGLTPSCKITDANFQFGFCVSYIFALVSYAILSMCAWFLSLAGTLFDMVLVYTVLEMATRVGDLPSIGQTWVILRDVVNIAFIFILLYIAIRTILSMNDTDTKKFIRNVVIAAILVNFSLFFTKVVIDMSNVVAIGFYRQIIPTGQTGGTAGDTISMKFVKPLGLQSIFSGQDADAFATDLAGKGFWRIVVQGIGGSIFIMLITLTFLYASILFLIRFIVLIFLMIFSGIAFLSFVLPKTKEYGEQWRDTLIGQAIFAPLYLFMIYFVGNITSELFKVTTGPTIADAINKGGVVAVGGTTNVPSIDAAVKFLIIIGLLNTATVMAKHYATKGGGKISEAIKWGADKLGVNQLDKIRERINRAPIDVASKTAKVGAAASLGTAGFLTRRTIGSIGSKLTDKDTAAGNALNRAALEGGFIKRNLARATLAVSGKAATSSFDARGVVNKVAGTNLGVAGVGGYEATLDAKAKKVQEDIEKYGGASKKTQGEIKSSRKAIAVARKKYRKATTDDERNAAMIEIKRAAGDLARNEGIKKGQIADQQLRYMTYVGTPRWFRPITAKHNKRAMTQFLRKVRPAKEDSADAVAKVKAEEINLAVKNSQDVGPILSTMTDPQIGKLPGTVFVTTKYNQPTSPNTYTPIGDTIKHLTPSNLKAMKDSLSRGEKNAIKAEIARLGTATPETTASNAFFTTTPEGKSW